MKEETMSGTSELEALRESAVFIDGEGHDVLRATGNDRVGFLHRITSGKVAGVEVGQGSRTLLLDVRGHVLASLLVFVHAKSLRLLVPGRQGAEVAAGLAKFAIMDDFQIAPEAELASLAVLGPKAGLALSGVGVPAAPSLLAAPLFAHEEVTSDTSGPLWIAHGRKCGADGLCVVTTRASRDALVAALRAGGTVRLPAELVEAARITALEPAPGYEITPERFPVEVGLGAAIDHTKGCYVGQETIVRMRDRGTVRKRLVLLRSSESDLPTAGDKIAAEGHPSAGQITSAARLPGERPVALAMLTNTVPVGAAVAIQHAGAELPAEVAAESPPWG
jgi:folate-binding protein YgfZ